MTGSRVFFSYKREDEARVYPMVRALEAAGVPVWWDRALPGAENWRENIQSALDDAGVVVVVWSAASVGPAGDFVRDEASRGKARGILVPVTIDRVAPPLGFGEIQSIDLSRWNGRSQRDPDFRDFVAAVRARLAGGAVPAATGPSARLGRRIGFGTAGLVAVALLGALAFNLFGVQNGLCGASERLSDLCGSAGLGDRPTREERLAWDARAPGSCPALRRHIARFPNGAHAAEASRLLAAATTGRAATAAPVERSGIGYVRTSEVPLASRAAAQVDALARAKADARIAVPACLAVGPDEQLLDVRIAPTDYRCDSIGGHRCGLTYSAACRFSVRGAVEICG
jgi:hypothetical protein